MRLVEISDAFEFARNGASIKQDPNASGIPITRIETIWNSTIDINRFGYANVKKADEYKNYLLENGDILMSHINSPKHLGKCAIYEDKPDALIHGMNLLNLRPLKNITFPKYIFYYLNTSRFKQQIFKISNQSVNQASFSSGNLKKLKIPLPPLAEQKKIAKILDAADSLRQKDQQLIDFYTALSQSLFFDMFGDPVTNPMGWDKVRLDSLGKITSGSTPSREIDEYYQGKIPWVKTAEVNGKLITKTSEFISKAALKNSSCRLNSVGSLLIAMYGQGKTRGQVGKLGIEAATNQACAVIPPSDDMNYNYLFLLLKLVYEDLRQLGRGGNQPNLNSGLIKSYQVISPPMNLQNQLAERIEIIEKQKQQAQANLEKSEALFNSLLQHAFKGELTESKAA